MESHLRFWRELVNKVTEAEYWVRDSRAGILLAQTQLVRTDLNEALRLLVTVNNGLYKAEASLGNLREVLQPILGAMELGLAQLRTNVPDPNGKPSK